MCDTDDGRTYNKKCGRCKETFETTDSLREWCGETCKEKFKTCRCKKCDRSFLAYQKRSYCVSECKRKECTVCDRTFIPNTSESYCSDACMTKKFTHRCKSCDEDFFKKQPTASYCSPSCRGAYESVKKYRIVCKHCKQVILVTAKNLLYCSETCSEAYRREAEKKRRQSEMSEDDLLVLVKSKVDELIDRRQDCLTHIVATVDFNERSGFTEALKEAVKRRDNYQCYICHNDSYIEVHHKLPQKLGGRHEEDNLISLCRRCHRHVETGNREHAYKKCLQNARSTYGNQSLFVREKLSQQIKLEYIEEELKRINENLIKHSNRELEESLILLDDLLDEVERYRAIR